MKTLDNFNPSTLEEAIDYIVECTPDEDIEVIRNSEETYSHFGFGMHVRNTWGLWSNNPLTEHFKTKYGLGHADDMSGLILDGAVCKIQGLTFVVEEEVKVYKTHWKNMGIDPLTLEKI